MPFPESRYLFLLCWALPTIALLAAAFIYGPGWLLIVTLAVTGALLAGGLQTIADRDFAAEQKR